MSIEIARSVHRLALSLPRYAFPNYPAEPSGICLFFEQGETAPLDGGELERIVCVLSHCADGSLRTMQARHFGPYRRLSGDRNRSPLRRNIGSAILLITDPYTGRVAGWYGRDRTRYADLEELVSIHLRWTFSFAVIPAPQQRDRVALTSALIALLARYPLAEPSIGWLGNYCSNSYVRRAGLWNDRHLTGPPLTSAQFEALARLSQPNP